MDYGQVPNGRILVADDDRMILDLFQATLAETGGKKNTEAEFDDLMYRLFDEKQPQEQTTCFDITLCSQGTEAIDQVRSAIHDHNPFSVVFLDIRMPPGPDGIRVAEQIRQLDPCIEIVIVTGFSDKTPREIALRVPPTDKLLYVQKPFHPHEIQQMAAALNSKWHAERKLRELQSQLEQRVQARTLELIVMNEKLKKEINERVRAEENLLKEKERLSTVLDSSPIPTFMVDRDHRVLLWNRAFENLSKISRDQAIGKTAAQAIGPVYEDNPPPILADLVLDLSDDQLKQLYPDKINALSTNDTYEVATSIWPEGDRRFLTTQATRIRDYKANIIGAIQCAQDVTEKILLQKQLQHAQKMEAIGTLAGGISHDFSNILQGIQSCAELLMMGKKDRDPEYDRLSDIFETAARGGQLVQQLLTFSRKVESKKQTVCLNHEVLRLKAILERILPKIEIKLQLADDLNGIHADPVQLEQILMNLAVNAKDAMPDGGSLKFHTSNILIDEKFCMLQPEAVPGDCVLLEVSDTGCGMDPKTLHCIFEPFFTTKAIGVGTGLGLSMVYGLVKSHNGLITCSSQPGRGTSFRIYLPACEQKQVVASKAADETAPGGLETILFVEDDPVILSSCAHLLTKAGYTVFSAQQGESALEIYAKEQQRIDLVILDLIIPGMGGEKCFNELLKFDPRARILITSGCTCDESVAQMLESGARGFIEKPYKQECLLTAIRAALGHEPRYAGNKHHEDTARQNAAIKPNH